MIALLTGRIDQIEEAACVIDVNGVGYLVAASSRTLAALPAPPGVARLLIETQVREDAIQLFGFADRAERDWFRLLTTVQGVGAKVGLNLLSALAPAELARAISAGEQASLTRATGVGARLAARLITELRGKVGGLPVAAGPFVPATGSVADDVLSALLNLGYRRPEAQAALARVSERLGEGANLDALIRDCLKELAR